MASKAFVIAGGTAAAIANDTADLRYRAMSLCVAPDSQLPVRIDARYETQYMVEDGIVTFMVGGAEATVFSGEFVRVPPGCVHACRNSAGRVARLLVRRVSPAPVRRTRGFAIGFAA